jgi:hypothetical protein
MAWLKQNEEITPIDADYLATAVRFKKPGSISRSRIGDDAAQPPSDRRPIEEQGQESRLQNESKASGHAQ